FTPEQRAAIDTREGDLLVSAAAGSGKTRVLVERLMDQVEAGADLTRFLIITFTRAAAAELKGRILEEIGRRSALRPSRHLRRQSALVYGADIGTIHAFCGKIIREFAHLLDLSPDFRTADENEANLLLGRALDDTLEARYADPEAHPGFTDLVDAVSEGRRDQALIDTVRNFREKRMSHADPSRWAADCLSNFDLASVEDAAETIWGGFLLDAAREAADYWLREMAEARESFLGDEAFDRAYGPSWDETLGGLARFVVATRRSWDSASAAAAIPFPRPKGVRGEGYEALKDLRRRCKTAIDKLTADFDLPTAELFDDLRAVQPVIGALIALTEDVERAYAKEKARRNCLDFADLEHLAVRLLVDLETGALTPVAEEIAKRYTELMIDEFQDVSGIQDLIFQALGAHGPRRFMVGDVKQSIYRFRLADPTIFLDYYRTRPEDTVLLGKNFRSHPGILEAVNFFFTRIMSESFGEMNYGPREALYPGKAPVGNDALGAPSPTPAPPVELDILDLKDLPDDGGQEKSMAEPRHIAAKIRALHEEAGYAWGDMAILLRSPSGKAGRYERALEELGIPVSKSGGASFFYTTEISAILSLLSVILNPRQDVPLIGAMRAPRYGFTPDELAEIRLIDQSGSFYEAVEQAAAGGEKCRRFLADLARYRDMVPDMRPDEFLWYLANETELMGPNVLALLAFARHAVEGGCRSLFDFVNLIESRREQGQTAGFAPAQGSTDAVTIMSIHKSKGLEFPVVFLPELARRFNHQDLTKQVLTHPKLGLGTDRRDLIRKIKYPTLAKIAIAKKRKQETLAEELRILYVGMTRAEARLILSAAFDDAEKTLETLAQKTADPVPPQILETATNVAQWVILPTLVVPDNPIQRNQITCQPVGDDAHIVPPPMQPPTPVGRDAPRAPCP
ncbi:MAG: UvrD-helicase domain-containing protein, partial [Oscillospiraceae bacterium]|nr:UvrD-helicase domain-containing protein [Oscillospiraceae bacterium]